MKVVDRFVCRREGHVPSLRFAPSPFVTSAACTCLRCGKWIEVEADPSMNTTAAGRKSPQDGRGQRQEGA